MYLSIIDMVLMSLGTIIGVIFVLMLLSGKKYDYLVEPLDSKAFPLCELYGAGCVFLSLTKHDFTTKGERKRRQQIALLYGEQHSEYYLYINAAERVTLTALLLIAGFVVYGLTADAMILGVFVMFAFTAYYYVATLPESKLKKKTDSILSDFADVVSKMALLVNAGMIMKEAWEKVSYTGDSELYQEMRLAVVNMNNGMSEIDAYTEFGARCTAPEIKKFTSTIIQGMIKGNKELVEMIKQQSREIWDAKRHRVKQEGEKAASKLLIPICIMFVGILIMIVVPIFANLGA